ncbi:MAG: PatB family C-S lyase [Bacteroidales bacterium]|nr:PatB family C-S lyase [Bacteroidales bacterium]
MKYNFDQIIPRENTHCYKYDLREKIFGEPNVTPMWVADMDFMVADEILNDINKRVRHGIFGYTFQYDGLYQSLINWMQKRHQWKIKEEEILFFHGVVPSVALAIHAFTEPGDKIIVQPPVYFPLFQTVENNRRKVIYNQLIYINGRYTMDFDDLESQIDDKVKMILLCHPHNPVGRAWTKEELSRLEDICQKHDILVVSDEIHSDIIFPGHTHIPFADLSAWAASNSITTVAPSKTFNIAGLAISAMIIPNKKLHSKISRMIRQYQLQGINLLGLVAFESAYNKGEEWLIQLLDYLNINKNFIETYIEQNIPRIRVTYTEATYLTWLNCKELGLNNKDLTRFMVEKAGLGLSEGSMFGPGGEGFQRINFACPKQLLIESMEKLKAAIIEI